MSKRSNPILDYTIRFNGLINLKFLGVQFGVALLLKQSKMKQIEITKIEYNEIYNNHKTNICLYSCYTDITGYGHPLSDGTPRWMTKWGLKDYDKPILKAETEINDGMTINTYYKYEQNKT